MARRASKSRAVPRLPLPGSDVLSAIDRLERCLKDVHEMATPRNVSQLSTAADEIAAQVNAAYADVYGPGTAEAEEARIDPKGMQPNFAPCPWPNALETFHVGHALVVARLRTTVGLLREELSAAPEIPPAPVLRAAPAAPAEVEPELRPDVPDLRPDVPHLRADVPNLRSDEPHLRSGAPELRSDEPDLHPDIEQGAGKLFRDGHHAEAVEHACNALNSAVKLRSRRDDLDGAPLMQRVFSVSDPVLAFNGLKDDGDRNEQEGLMHLFTGAVLAFSNPRAQLRDHPEHALEFIQFMSLLAKLLESAR